MCHVSKPTTFSELASPVVPSKPVIYEVEMSLSSPSPVYNKPKISPFRRIAKSARINLNKYWGLLSQKQRKEKTSRQQSSVARMTLDFSAELEQNRINEMLEARANAEEQNSINSQIESELSTPEQPRRLHFVRQRAIFSSISSSSCSSSCCQSCLDYQQDSISQDSVFL